MDLGEADLEATVVTFEPMPVTSGTGTNTGNGSFGITVDGPPGSSKEEGGVTAMQAACTIGRNEGEPYLVVHRFVMSTRGGHGRALFVVSAGDAQSRAMFEALDSIIDAQTCRVINPDVSPSTIDW